jgi:hypothetical protein
VDSGNVHDEEGTEAEDLGEILDDCDVDEEKEERSDEDKEKVCR